MQRLSRSRAPDDSPAGATRRRLAALNSGGRLARFARGGALLVAAFALTACARTSRLASTWKDPGFRDSSLARLLVVAVGRSPGERRRFEDRFVAALRTHGMDARASYPFIGDARADSALVEAQVRQAGCDAIFVSRVVDRQMVRRSYGTVFGPVGYYGPPSRYHAGWWPYYAFGYASTTDGAFAVEDQRVSVETNLYRHVDGQLVWSGLSRQWLAADDGPGAETASVVRELVGELAQSGVVRRSAALTAARAAALPRAP